MLNYRTRIIQGFRIPDKKLFGKIEVSKYRCKHKFNRDKINYCPKCGKESKRYFDTEWNSLINIDWDKLGDNEDKISDNLVLCKATTNLNELEADNNDSIIGIECLNDCPKSPENEINYIKHISKKTILEEIKKINKKIPFSKNSFGMYVIFDVY